MRKCVFVISDQVRFKTASSATETRYIIEILYLARVGILLSRQRTKRCWSDCKDAQAVLRLYCSHMSFSRFLHDVAHFYYQLNMVLVIIPPIVCDQLSSVVVCTCLGLINLWHSVIWTCCPTMNIVFEIGWLFAIQTYCATWSRELQIYIPTRKYTCLKSLHAVSRTWS